MKSSGMNEHRSFTFGMFYGSPNYLLLTVTGVATIGCLLSLRKQVKLEQECQKLQRALGKRKQKQKQLSRSVDDDGTNDAISYKDTYMRSTLNETQSLMENGLTVKPIGVVRSIYRLCVGTPRQGLLAPAARGCIDLIKLGDSSPVDSVDGLEGYSHIWILFVFHLNTRSKNAAKNIKSKITPPASGGQRAGIFATRTPHRYNPIGISLCKLERIEKVGKKEVTLHISGLDLVDGTPVVDIKPYVPIYDSVDKAQKNSGGLRLPPWVAEGLTMKRSVAFSESAKADLLSILEQNSRALEFYGPNMGEMTVDETLNAALECIRQVLAIDVRSSHQTKKARSGKFQAERSGRLKDVTTASSGIGACTPNDEDYRCTQQLDNLLIHYRTEEAATMKRSQSENSGAEDNLFVTTIELLVR